MRIVSKFKDYYDNAQDYTDQDESLVYPRNTVVVERGLRDRTWPSPINEVEGFIRYSASLDNRYQAKFDLLIVKEGFCVIFCGKMYPMVVVEVHEKRPLLYSPVVSHRECFYSMDALDKFMAKQSDKNQECYKVTRPYLEKKYFIKLESKKIEDWCVRHKIPIALLSDPWSVTLSSTCLLHPKLSDYNFQRVFSAPQAFQEISMFLGNIAAPDNVPVTVSDKDRIQQHGFDKWSFRKMPEGN